MSDMFEKILGLAAGLCGLALLAADCVVIIAIGAIGEYIALEIGMTGLAVLGVKIIMWVVLFGVVATIAMVGVFLILISLGLLKNWWL